MRESARRVAWYWWAIAYFTLLTLGMTWPLVLRMRDSIVGGYGDNLYYIWLIGWVERAIFVLHRSPLITHLINYPEGWWLAGDEVTPVMVLTGLPFSLLGGEVLGYNASVLLSFVLSGLVVCWWVHRWTGRLFAGLVAGTLFAFSAYRVSHYIVGHLQLLGTQWLALFFMAMYESLERSPRSKTWPAVAGLSLGAAALTSQYYMYMTFVLSALIPLVHVGLRGTRYVFCRAYQTRLLIVALVAAPLVLFAEYPYLQASAADRLPVREVDAAIRNSATPTDYLLPPTWNPLVGEWIGERFDRQLWGEATLYLGIAACLTGLAGLILPSGQRVEKATLLHILLIALCALVLSFGPHLKLWSGEPRIQLPGQLAWLEASRDPPTRLPASLLYEYLRYYTSLRVPARYGVYVFLFLSVLSGIGFAGILRLGRRSVRAVMVALLLAIMTFELLPWKTELVRVGGRPVDDWLAAQPGDGAVVQLPLTDAGSEKQAYFTLIHGKPSVSGHDNLRTPLHRKLLDTLGEIPDREGLALLRSIGVRYILVDTGWYEEIDALDDLDDALVGLGIDEVASFAGYRVYLLEP